MKFLILLPVVATVLLASSCRMITPLDPMTMRQSGKCLPAGLTLNGVSSTK